MGVGPVSGLATLCFLNSCFEDYWEIICISHLWVRNRSGVCLRMRHWQARLRSTSSRPCNTTEGCSRPTLSWQGGWLAKWWLGSWRLWSRPTKLEALTVVEIKELRNYVVQHLWHVYRVPQRKFVIFAHVGLPFELLFPLTALVAFAFINVVCSVCLASGLLGNYGPGLQAWP